MKRQLLAGLVIGCVQAAATCATAAGDARTGITWVTIEGGRFQMGTDESGGANAPAHSVQVPAFRMAKTHVTVAQYRRCVDDKICAAPISAQYCNDEGECSVTDKYCNYGKVGREDHPVNCVGWNDARIYAAWAGGRLPSEAEWEYAAKSRGEGRKHPWGSDEPTCARAVIYENGREGCGAGGTMAVSFTDGGGCARPLGQTVQGLCDMAGNAWQWVQDAWHRSYAGAPDDGRAWEDAGSRERVIRGGHFTFDDNPEYLRTDYRGLTSAAGHPAVGFRIVKSGR